MKIPIGSVVKIIKCEFGAKGAEGHIGTVIDEHSVGVYEVNGLILNSDRQYNYVKLEGLHGVTVWRVNLDVEYMLVQSPFPKSESRGIWY